MENLMLQTIWLPFVGGLLCLLLFRVHGETAEAVLDIIRRVVTVIISAYSFYLGIRLFLNPGAFFEAGWIKLGSLTTRVILHAKPLASIMVLFSGMFAFLISIFSWKYRAHANHNGWYYGLFLLSLASANAVFFAGDLFTLTIAWEISTVCLFGLIVLGDNEKSGNAAGKTLVILGLAEAAMLFAVAYIWFKNNTLVISELRFGFSGVHLALFLCLVASALAKAGAIPLHSWIPSAAEGAPTSVMAYLPASVDKLLGIYFLFMVTNQLFVMTYGMKLTLMIIGVVTIIVAVMMAMLQHDWRRLLSFHAVSQVGYMVLGIGTGHPLGIIGALFHMINNALYKNSLFLCCGVVEKATGTTDLARLGGLGRKMPVIFFANIVSAFAISGVPPFNGFISKWIIYQACVLIDHPIMFILAVFGSALTLASFIKVLYSVYMGPLPSEFENVKAPGFALTFPPLVLALICILFGLVPGLPVGKMLIPATNLPVGGQVGSFWLRFGGGYWQPIWALGLILLGVIIAYIYYMAGNALRARKARAFVGGIKPGTAAGYHTYTYDAMRVPGTGFYNNVKEVPILSTILPDAEKGSFDPYTYIEKIGYALFVKPLKILHDGVLSMYLSWAIVGFVIIFVVLLK